MRCENQHTAGTDEMIASMAAVRDGRSAGDIAEVVAAGIAAHIDAPALAWLSACQGTVLGWAHHSDREGNDYVAVRMIRARAAWDRQCSSSRHCRLDVGAVGSMKCLGTCDFEVEALHIHRSESGCRCSRDDPPTSYHNI